MLIHPCIVRIFKSEPRNFEPKLQLSVGNSILSKRDHAECPLLLEPCKHQLCCYYLSVSTCDKHRTAIGKSCPPVNTNCLLRKRAVIKVNPCSTSNDKASWTVNKRQRHRQGTDPPNGKIANCSFLVLENNLSHDCNHFNRTALICSSRIKKSVN